MRCLCVAALLVCAATAGARDASSLSDDFDAHNWAAIGRTAGETHYSPLTEINRETEETKVALRLDLDGGDAKVSTGVGFLDHMLELLARHGRLGLEVEASGDLQTGAHHTTEDVGICLGQAIDEALGDRAGIRRYGSALVPMDEALGECAIDISGRPYCAFDAELPDVTIAGFDSELT